ncbi:MAG: RNA polymerase sigma factor [Vicinamibacteria bacterium]|nr:RNA polymerase sigma factor [Vicinamibacteria bacterium]
MEPGASFDEVIAREGAALSRLAASYERDPALREDLFQEICLAVWRALRTYRGDSSVRTFVFRIAHNRAVSHVVKRAASKAQSLDALEAEPPSTGRSVEEHLDLTVRAERLQSAIAGLPLGLRQPVIMALEGFKAREIAEVLGISENAVSIRMTRARQVLKEALSVAGEGKP